MNSKSKSLKIIAAVFGGLFLLLLSYFRSVMERMPFLLMITLISLAAGAIALIFRKKRDTVPLALLLNSMMMISLVSLSLFMMTSLDYTFLSGMFPFLLPAVLIGLAISVITLWIVRHRDRSKEEFQKEGEEKPRKKTKGQLVALFLTAMILSTVFLNGILCHFNYLLGDKEGESFSCVITDRRRVNATKGGDSYYLTLKTDEGEVELRVASSVYYSYSVGDQYVLHRYEGAFDEAFYLGDDAS